MKPIDTDALFHLACGLYIVTSRDMERDNGLVINTVTQVTNSPNMLAVTINKLNYSHILIKTGGKMNVNCLTEKAPFCLIERFGFSSGRDTDKFRGIDYSRTDNDLPVLSKYVNSFFSLDVEGYIDLNTHGMFICSIREAVNISDEETMTYSYYQKHVKPQTKKIVKGYVCKVCGYVYEGNELPENFQCPVCKHGAADFEAITIN